jgi:RNA polymerase sigma-70 factor (ECF subfamily)
LEFQTFDASYLNKLRSSDLTTERHFVNYFGELITLKLRSRLQSPEAVEDVKQETFARFFTLLRKDSGVREAERLGSLVNSICNHVLFEYYRAGKRTEPLDDVAAVNLLDKQTDALDRVISSETSDDVHKVLNGLAERDRKVLRSLFVEERDKDTVCREMGISREYIRVLVHRAKKAFREQSGGVR